MIQFRKALPLLTVAYLGAACGGDQAAPTVASLGPAGTCTGVYPSYWQDPGESFAEQWAGQLVSNQPPTDWDGPVFRLSDDFPRSLTDETSDQPWRSSEFDPLFEASTDEATREQLALDYSWAVMEYIQEGNIGADDVELDWTLCENPVRGWYHIPYQTYDVLSGREFVHGLTREAPVSFSLNTAEQRDGPDVVRSTMWAVAFFNPTAGYTLGTVWQPDGTPIPPTENVSFAEGAVVGKLLFNTLSPAQLTILQNMPAWTANISAPTFCNEPITSPMVRQSEACPRTVDTDALRLLQFDIAVKDSRAPVTGWVFGTFVADGVRKAAEPQPWNRISPLGLMWGNDPPPEGGFAQTSPPPSSYTQEVIFADVVDMLNDVGGDVESLHPGHLGCNDRLNGPADNANSTCMSCHATASVPDTLGHVPPIVTQFSGGTVTSQCVVPDAPGASGGDDESGTEYEIVRNVSFSDIDRVYFRNTPAAAPFDVSVGDIADVLGSLPQYRDGRTEWISLDYSIQLSISLAQWDTWQKNQALEVDQSTTQQRQGQGQVRSQTSGN